MYEAVTRVRIWPWTGTLFQFGPVPSAYIWPCFDAEFANSIVNETTLEEAEPLITSTGESVEAPTDAPTPLQEIGARFAGVSFVCMREILREHETLADIEAAIKRYHQDPQAFEAALIAKLPENG